MGESSLSNKESLNVVRGKLRNPNVGLGVRSARFWVHRLTSLRISAQDCESAEIGLWLLLVGEIMTVCSASTRLS